MRRQRPGRRPRLPASCPHCHWPRCRTPPLAHPRCRLRHRGEHRLPVPPQPWQPGAGGGYQRRSPGAGATAHAPLRGRRPGGGAAHRAAQPAGSRTRRPLRLHQLGGRAAPPGPTRGGPAGPGGPTGAPGGIASVPLCRCRALGDPPQPKGPQPAAGGHRRTGAEVGAPTIQRTASRQSAAAPSRAALGAGHQGRFQLRRHVPASAGNQLRPAPTAAIRG